MAGENDPAELTPEARAELREAVRIVREDKQYSMLSALHAGLSKPPNVPEPPKSGSAPPSGDGEPPAPGPKKEKEDEKPPPPPKPDGSKDEPPKRRGLWWGDQIPEEATP